MNNTVQKTKKQKRVGVGKMYTLMIGEFDKKTGRTKLVGRVERL